MRRETSLLVILFFEAWWAGRTRSQFMECHDDPAYDAEEGTVEDLQYTWLGVLQYIHIRNGTPHYFRAPRVVLLSRLFALSTAVDAAILPDGYALGNVVFGDYERDERECGLPVADMASRDACERATLILPLSDVLLHPEFKHFGAPDSIALLKLLTYVRSQYMVPVCVPFKNFLPDGRGEPSARELWHVDFASDVPRDFSDEEKQVSKINLLPKELCFLYDPTENVTNIASKRVVCSTGCGFHSGAPTAVHEHTGHWTLVAISTGGAPCPDPLRARRPPPPPRHIALHPYVPWITAAVTGRALQAFSKDDPFGYTMQRTTDDMEESMKVHDMFHGWVGHWWMGGIRCYDRGDNALDLFKFYRETFVVTPSEGQTLLSYFLQIYGPPGTSVVCIKVGMPYRMAKPKVWDLDSAEVQLKLEVVRLYHRYSFMVEGFAYNATQEISRDSEDEPTPPSSEQLHEDSSSEYGK